MFLQRYMGLSQPSTRNISYMSTNTYLSYSATVSPPSLEAPPRSSNLLVCWICDNSSPDSGLYGLVAGMDPWAAFESFCKKYDFGYELTARVREYRAQNRVFWIYNLTGIIFASL